MGSMGAEDLEAEGGCPRDRQIRISPAEIYPSTPGSGAIQGTASMRQEQSQARKSVHMSGSRSGSQSGLVAWCRVGAWP